MARRGWGRLCARQATAWLLAAACAWAAAQTPAESVVVGPGQSATEIALDQVPAGTTIDQFLLALYRRNPQAFIGGDLHRLLVRARLTLPTADEANQVPLTQAREELGRLAQGLPPPADAAEAQIPAPSAAVPSPNTPPAAEPTAPPPPGALATATAAASQAPNWALWGTLAALAALAAGMLARRADRRGPAAPAAAQASAPDDAQAQGRFQPVLPQERSAPPQKKTPDAPPPVTAPKPALFDLDLNLDGKAPPLDLPPAKTATLAQPAPPKSLDPLGALPDLDLGSPAPLKASAPGPLDLSSISLDLGPAPTPKDRP